MEEIEVGEYVRIKNGDIRKIVRITEGKEKTVFGKYGLDKPYNNCYSVAKSKIIKHSKNIIDLIEEEGDYVNGEKIIEILDKNETYNGKKLVCSIRTNFGEEDIKSIVTKEQFKSVEYEVK